MKKCELKPGDKVTVSEATREACADLIEAALAIREMVTILCQDRRRSAKKMWQVIESEVGSLREAGLAGTYLPDGTLVISDVIDGNAVVEERDEF
jgi:hypothetical protein